MKKSFYPGIALAALLILTLSNAIQPLPIGASIPGPLVKMKDITGKQISFKDAMKKNGLLVMFTCNTCPVVKKYQSRTLEVTAHAVKNNVGVILINSNEGSREDGDSFDDMKAYAKGQGYQFNYVMDNGSAMADAFGANRTPEVYLFNKDAKLVYHGAIDDNPNGADQVSRKHAIIALDELVTGKAVSVKETKSVGCSIRRRD